MAVRESGAELPMLINGFPQRDRKPENCFEQNS
jgi:hypothetical protein